MIWDGLLPIRPLYCLVHNPRVSIQLWTCRTIPHSLLSLEMAGVIPSHPRPNISVPLSPSEHWNSQTFVCFGKVQVGAELEDLHPSPRLMSTKLLFTMVDFARGRRRGWESLPAALLICKARYSE